jgi:methionyl-tRNA formyltransferase
MKLVMMGTGSFAEPTFRKLFESAHQVVGLVTQPDRATGKERGSTRQAGQPMKELAVERGIPVLQPESINTPEGVAALQALAPDLLVVAAYGQILSKDVLGIAPKGGINVHASLLPKYRGAAPINWAIYHGETKTGVTIIRMTTGLDAGDMLVQEAIDILPDETAGELEARLGPLGARLAIETVDKLAVGPVAGIPQDKAQVTKAPKLTKEHGLIDWSRPAVGVVNQIRAMQPWPTAYTYLHRDGFEPVRLMVQRVVLASRERQRPEQVVADGNRLFARCGDGGWIEILDLQPAGKRRMSAQDFLRGNAIPPDARFGSELP